MSDTSSSALRSTLEAGPELVAGQPGEKWQLTFYGSPTAVSIWSGIPGRESRREIAYLECADRAARTALGLFVRALVHEHNARPSEQSETRGGSDV